MGRRWERFLREHPVTKPQPELPHTDYRGRPLAVGDSIAFISNGIDGPALFTGRIALIHGDQLCVESGHLLTLKGAKVGAGVPRNPDRIRHAIVHLIADTDAGEQQ
jgi:hypothetical protein